MAVRHRVIAERDGCLALPRQVRVADFHRDERGNCVGGIVEGDGADAGDPGREKVENVTEKIRAVVRRVSGFRHSVERERKENDPSAAVPSGAWKTNAGASTRPRLREHGSRIGCRAERVGHIRADIGRNRFELQNRVGAVIEGHIQAARDGVILHARNRGHAAVFVAVVARPAQRIGVRTEFLHLKNVPAKRHVA